MRDGLLGYPTVFALASDHTFKKEIVIGELECGAH